MRLLLRLHCCAATLCNFVLTSSLSLSMYRLCLCVCPFMWRALAHCNIRCLTSQRCSVDADFVVCRLPFSAASASTLTANFMNCFGSLLRSSLCSVVVATAPPQSLLALCLYVDLLTLSHFALLLCDSLMLPLPLPHSLALFALASHARPFTFFS